MSICPTWPDGRWNVLAKRLGEHLCLWEINSERAPWPHLEQLQEPHARDGESAWESQEGAVFEPVPAFRSDPNQFAELVAAQFVKPRLSCEVLGVVLV